MYEFTLDPYTSLRTCMYVPNQRQLTAAAGDYSAWVLLLLLLLLQLLDAETYVRIHADWKCIGIDLEGFFEFIFIYLDLE